MSADTFWTLFLVAFGAGALGWGAYGWQEAQRWRAEAERQADRWHAAHAQAVELHAQVVRTWRGQPRDAHGRFARADGG